jgi:GNAT superfamily N-acetyltransferase
VESARDATVDDVPRLAELCREALAEIRPARGGEVYVSREARAEPVEESLATDVAEHIAVVGTLDDVIVGYATGVTEEIRDGTRLGRITDLFVEGPARGVGVGEAIMRRLLARFGEQACAGIDATALPGARETKNFFEGSGFSARLLVMHHRMPADESEG